jgi:hypothetical protein
LRVDSHYGGRYREVSMADSDRVVPYSPAESAQIRAMFSASNATVVCPRCRGALKFVSVPGADPQTGEWELECAACRRRLVIAQRTSD